MLIRGIPFSLRLPALSVWVLALSAASTAVEVRADVSTPGGKKPGVLGGLFGKKEKAPAPTTPAPAASSSKSKTPAASKPSSVPGPRPKVITIKPRSPGGGPTTTSTKSSGTTPKKSQELVKKTTEPAKPAPSTAKKSDSEFTGDADDTKSETKPEVTAASPAPLPAASQAGGWDIVKVNGRDYVTGESIHRFYRFASYKVEGTHVWLRSNNLIMKGQVGRQELLINNIKFILSYPILDSGGRALFSRLDLCKLIDPVLRPSHITDAQAFDTVVIDAGHGGHDTGARGVYGYEKDFALKMAFVLRDILQRRGLKVILTRSTDTFLTLGGRVAIANQTPNSIFVSLHFNSGGTAASGIETFALTPQGSSASLERGGGYNANGLTGNAHDSANIALATAVHAMVISRFKFVDRGIKRAQWSVLTGCKRAGILFEGGFVTNPTECRLIVSDTYRTSVCTAIADAISNYRRAMLPALGNRR